jgi:hypothetical protein
MASACLLSLGVAGSADDAPVKGEAVKKAAPAKGDATGKARANDKAKAGAMPKAEEDSGPITIADWLDLGGKVVDAVNELFGARRAARAVRAPAAVAAAPAAQLQQFENQYGPRFRQVYKSELHLMRIVCQPTREQFDKISAGGEADLKAAIKKCGNIWVEQRQKGMRQDQEQPEARQLVGDAVARSVKSVLSAEQTRRYQQELDRRAAARRRVVLTSLVAAIDRRLVLAADQRAQLTDILEKNWRATWSQTQMLVQDGDFLPALPDDKIVPILSEKQKSVWREMQKGNFYLGFDLDTFQGFDMADEVWPAGAGK